jgi:transcription elongation factor Elf1
MLNPLNETLLTTKCPECREKMLVKVRLDAPPGDNFLTCPVCGRTVVPLVPGPVIEGPYASPE